MKSTFQVILCRPDEWRHSQSKWSQITLRWVTHAVPPLYSHRLKAYCTVIVRVSYGYGYTRGSGLVWVEIFGAGRVRVRVASSATGTGRVAKMVDPHTPIAHLKLEMLSICCFILRQNGYIFYAVTPLVTNVTVVAVLLLACFASRYQLYFLLHCTIL